MPILRVESLDDPRLEIYRALKGNNRTRDLGLFIAEGTTVVRRLLDSDFDVHSILISDKKYDTFADAIPDNDIPVYRLTHDLARELVGYSFHSGVLAAGRRQPSPDPCAIAEAANERCLFIVAPHLNDPENVGALIRIGSAFGVDAVLFGSKCSDPFSRRVLRVSMANGLFLPVIESPDIVSDLRSLEADHNVELMATVLDDDAVSLESAPHPGRAAIVFGHETSGLDRQLIEICDHKVTIPMRNGTDSLNVAVSAGIVLYAMSR